MNIELLSKDNGKINILVKDSSDFFLNTIRRMILEEVPTLAIEDIEFNENNSALYDEQVGLRLGLIPIKTDLKSYNLKSECKCNGEGCSMCQLKLTLKSSQSGLVLSESLVSKDPKCGPVHKSMPVVKLIKGQGIELIATAEMGQGKEHMKWSPGHVFYKGAVGLTKNDSFNKEKSGELIQKCGGLIKESGQGFEVTDLSRWNDSYEQICEDYGVDVSYSDKDFILTIESWGQLDAKDMVDYAVRLTNKKLDEFIKLIK